MTLAIPMFPPRLHVIDGGPQPSDAEGVEPIADHGLGSAIRHLGAGPARCAALAEAEAGRMADLVAPAIAVAFTAEARLVQIAAADVAEAVRTRDAFREAVSAARVVLDVFQAAEARLLVAITAAVRHPSTGAA
jgi:hypothetical protein